MKAEEFKNVISEYKETLRGCQLTISFIEGNTVTKHTYNTLRAFGMAILDFEKKGSGFGFIGLGNDVCNRPTPTQATFTNKINKGNWNKAMFLATTVK